MPYRRFKLLNFRSSLKLKRRRLKIGCPQSLNGNPNESNFSFIQTELTIFEMVIEPMNNPLGVCPSKGNQGTPRGKEKIFWPLLTCVAGGILSAREIKFWRRSRQASGQAARRMGSGYFSRRRRSLLAAPPPKSYFARAYNTASYAG